MNRTKGTVIFDAGGQTYTLVFSTNALCILETNLGDSIWSAFDDPGKMRISTMRTVFWAGLQEHHPQLDKAGVGRLMDELGMPAVLVLIMDAVAKAFPEAKPGDRPLAPAARALANGIGTTS